MNSAVAWDLVQGEFKTMELVLGVDLGTSYFKLGLFDRAGKIRGLGRVFVQKDVDDGLRCELQVDHFWKLLREGLSQACGQAHAHPADIQALAYSSQAGSFVLLDQKSDPLTPLVIWLDRRAEKIDIRVQQLWERSDFLRTTGLDWKSPESCIVKLCWFQQHEPDLWSRTNRIMTISDYLAYSLTGIAAGDQGTASLLGTWDLQKGIWWDDALQLLNLSASQLSEQFRPGTVAGRISAGGAQRLGLKRGIPLAVGSLDHHVAAIGAGLGKITDLSESTGTVLACLNYTQNYEPKSGCCLGAGHLPDTFYQMAFDANSADVLNWYRQKYAPDLTFDKLVEMAASVPPGCDGLVAKPSANQYDDFKGFENLRKSHHHGHFVRAIMESVALSLQKLIHQLCGNTVPQRIAATGGGAKSDLWLQIKADLLGTEMVATESNEAACMGAALLAALAANWFDNVDQAASEWISISRVFTPKR